MLIGNSPAAYQPIAFQSAGLQPQKRSSSPLPALITLSSSSASLVSSTARVFPNVAGTRIERSSLTYSQMFDIPSTSNKDWKVHKRSKSSPQIDESSGSFRSGWDSSTLGNGFQDILAAPPAALTSTPTRQDPQLTIEEKARPKQPRPHQRQLTEILSFHKLPALHIRSTASSPTRASTKHNTLQSPSKESDFQWSTQPSPHLSSTNERRSFIPTLTGDKSGQIRTEDKGGKLADWFRGESEPVNLGVLPSPTKEKPDPLEAMSSPAASRPPLSHPPQIDIPTKHKPLQPSAPPDDEFLTLDITAALFPQGPLTPSSPPSFQTLLQNAESVLQRLQTAYKQRTTSLHDLTASYSAQAEELSEAETRARHLKQQLNNVTHKLAEQDAAMMNLVDELAREKQLRREEEEARKRSVKLVRTCAAEGDNDGLEEERSKFGRHGNRGSVASDSGFESEDESSACSVFSSSSKCQDMVTSPCPSLSSASDTTSPELHQAEFLTITPARPRPAMPPQRGSMFQKVLGMNGTSGSGLSTPKLDEFSRPNCRTCQGVKASEAWKVVSILKEENKGLKERVGHLEGAVEGCLEMVGGM
ncbi:hypothetical protein LPUS_10089 [Lasallia pustulata]|uniref:Uncharacterized protein n=1 Tax=Lasallia pustulata TaxID=136370 RepID=A0A1W5D9F3_9LECA|nr:hypothetical protein LPUS_10089 [Lasallia pustulata]